MDQLCSCSQTNIIERPQQRGQSIAFFAKYPRQTELIFFIQLSISFLLSWNSWVLVLFYSFWYICQIITISHEELCLNKFLLILGTKRSIAVWGRWCIIFKTKKLIDNARAILIFVFNNHAIDFTPILLLTIILWDTISSGEVNLGSSMKINHTAISLSG